MRGSIRRRGPSWTIVLDLGYAPDPKTGQMRRKQKFVTFRGGKNGTAGTKRQAQDKLTDLLKALKDGQYVDGSKITLGEWLREWLKGVSGRCRPATVARYTGIIEGQLLKAPIASMRVQQIRASHVEQYYASVKASASTLTLHHTILLQCFKKAVRDRIVPINVVADVETKPRRARDKGDEARLHCWTADEARRFLEAAKADSSQSAAFYALALDSGARKGELCGLGWQNVDLDAGTIRIVQQLLKPGATPVFGPLKAGRPRTITLATETVRLLAAHKRAQAEVKMANRQQYHDHELVFAKEYRDLQRAGDMLGHPLQMNNLGQREYARLVKTADVRRIKFHGLRHTCATLLLQAGEPVHVVSERLGHSKITMTLEVYSHVLPNMQQRAAATIGAVLHG